MSAKKKGRMMKNPQMKKQQEKFAREIATLLTDHFEKAKDNAESNGGEFKFEMNEEIKVELEKKGKEMSSFVKTMMEDKNKNEINKMNHRNHAMKVSIR